MKKIIYILSALLFNYPLNAQVGIEWEMNYGSSGNESGQGIISTYDGGYILVGSSSGDDGDVASNNGNTDVWLVKTDIDGNIEWEENYGGSSTDQGFMVIQTPDSGYVVIGSSSSSNFDVSSNYGMLDMWLFKTDVSGNLLWEQNYGTGLMNGGYSVELTTDSGFILCGFSNGIGGDVAINNGQVDIWLVKTDNLGNLIWEKSYGSSQTDYGFKAMQTSDGGYIVLGHSEISSATAGVNNGSNDFLVIKTDSIGTVEWEEYYGGSSFEYGYDIQSTDDSGYIIAGSSSSNQGDVGGNNGLTDVWLIKIDSTGNLLWEQNYGGSGSDHGREVKQTSDGGFIVLGHSNSTDDDISWNNGNTDLWLFKTDLNGNLVWEQSFGGSLNDLGLGLILTADEQVISIGQTGSNDGDVSGTNGSDDLWMIKTKSYIGRIYGSVIVDNNEDCLYNAGDTTYAGVVITGINNSNQFPVYGYTNSLGEYVLETDTASYTISYALPSSLYAAVACSADTQVILLSDSVQQDSLDFYVDAIVDCPLMTVDISTPLLRRCWSSNYVVSYCNEGTIPADSVYIIVELDPNLIVDSTSIPYDSVDINTYAFSVGDVGLFACGNIYITVTVDCDSALIGQILCSEAHIFPDTFCLPDTTTWNGAQLQAKATCIGTDTVEFELKNIGAGNMGGDVPIIAIEDVLLVIDDLVQLNAGASQIWTIPINGNTQRIIAGQPANHPFLSFTTDAVSFCNTTGVIAPGPIIDANFLSFPNDEEAPYVAVDCQPIIGAYDPNDKSVSPAGVSSEHFISETMDLEYKIRFQNTGNDTAFNIYITDSISSFLDITSIKPGAASHPYVIDIYGNGVLKFSFDNIQLVDSFTNEPASHGFVQYKIKQKAGNEVGDIINNNADIFFDFNPPIRTNTTFNKIGGMILDTLLYEEPIGIRKLQHHNISVYPNPASDYMTFELDEKVAAISLQLFDVNGSVMHQIIAQHQNSITLHRNQLAAGTYFFKIAINGKDNARGTMIFK